MFGLREEIIAAILAVTLLVIAGFCWYLHALQAERDSLMAANTTLQVSNDAYAATQKRMQADAAAKERAYAEANRAKGEIQQKLAAALQSWEDLTHNDPTVHAWADTALPAAARERLHAHGSGAAVRPGDTTGGAAGADSHP